jgi:septal ring factor EnvC (AmiA/AmiB activator)
MANDKNPLTSSEPAGDEGDQQQPDLELNDSDTSQAEPEGDSGQEPKTFDEDYVKKLRDEAAKYRTDLRDTQKELDALKKTVSKFEKSQSEQEQEELKKQGEWKAVAEQNAMELAKLEDVADQLERYKATLTDILDGQREGIPAPVVDLLDRMEPIEQLEWLAKNKGELVKPEPQQQNRQQLADFNPQGNSGPAENDEQRIARMTRNMGQMVSPFGSQK